MIMPVIYYFMLVLKVQITGGLWLRLGWEASRGLCSGFIGIMQGLWWGCSPAYPSNHDLVDGC